MLTPAKAGAPFALAQRKKMIEFFVWQVAAATLMLVVALKIFRKKGVTMNQKTTVGYVPAESSIDKNLLTLGEARRSVDRLWRDTGMYHLRSVERFYHLALMECADQMTAAQFKRAIQVAKKRLSDIK
jgi:hypothetical protein